MAEITVTIPNSTFTVTTPASGFTVTTPADQVIEVGGVGQTIDITSTPTAITVSEVGITNTDQLIEGSVNLFYTNARVSAYLTANNYATESYVDDAIADIDYPVDSVNGQTGTVVLDTDDINEGTTNLYFTTNRFNTNFDTRLATKTTSNLTEGSNLYYTTARSNSDFDTRLATKSTSDLAEGSNLYYTTTRWDTRLATKTTDDLTEGSTNLYFTDARVESHVFAAINIDSRAYMDTATLTTTATTADQVVDTWSATTYRSVKYQVQITSGTDYQAMEILVVHNGTTATQVIYADVKTNTDLASFSVDINSGSVRLLTTPTNAATTYKVVRTALTA